jgi:hypothetical protein
LILVPTSSALSTAVGKAAGTYRTYQQRSRVATAAAGKGSPFFLAPDSRNPGHLIFIKLLEIIDAFLFACLH